MGRQRSIRPPQHRLGYLYPPASLLYFKALLATQGFVKQVAYVTMTVSIVAVGLSLWLLAGHWSAQMLYWSTLLFLSAGHIETFVTGRINGFVLCLVVGFYCAWHANRRWVLAVSFKATPVVCVLFMLTPQVGSGLEHLPSS